MTKGSDLPSVGVDAVNRALSLLACFRDNEESLSLSELAARSGFYKSTILRLAASLEAGRLLTRLSDKSFAIGPEALRLATIYQRSLRIEGRVRPVLKRLLDSVGESASFFRREGDKRVCLFREESAHSIRDHVLEGELLPLSTGAAGHVLTLFDPALASRAEIAGRGMDLPLFSYGERDPEIAAAAVPVFWHRHGEVGLVGALAISGPIGRFSETLSTRIRETLLAEGRELSSALGGSYEVMFGAPTHEHDRPPLETDITSIRRLGPP